MQGAESQEAQGLPADVRSPDEEPAERAPTAPKEQEEEETVPHRPTINDGVCQWGPGGGGGDVREVAAAESLQQLATPHQQAASPLSGIMQDLFIAAPCLV